MKISAFLTCLLASAAIVFSQATPDGARWVRSGEAQAVVIRPSGVTRVWLNQVPESVLRLWGLTLEKANAETARVKQGMQNAEQRRAEEAEKTTEMVERSRYLVGRVIRIRNDGLLIQCDSLEGGSLEAVKAAVASAGGIDKVYSPNKSYVRGEGLEPGREILIVGHPQQDRIVSSNHVEFYALYEGIVKLPNSDPMQRWRFLASRR